MLRNKMKGLLVKTGALLTAGAVMFSATPSHAQTLPMPASSAVVITKLDQPADAGGPANGLEQTTTATPIPGVGFEAYEVPVTDQEDAPLTKGSEEWQRAIADIDLATALARIGTDPTAVRSGTTDASGVIAWDGTEKLDRGLYLIRETSTPTLADGRSVVAAGDFLLPVPLTHPTDLDRWLDTIYVYPKNDLVGGVKTVDNDTDYSVGDTVTWTIKVDNPKIRDHSDGSVFIPTDRFEIWDTLTDAQLTLENDLDPEDSVNVTSPTGLVKHTDYRVLVTEGPSTVPAVADGETLVRVVFTEDGRAKLAGALNAVTPVTSVVVTLDTVVESAGSIVNEAVVFPGGDSTFEVTPAEVRYGGIGIEKLSTEGDEVDLEGAEFRVYLTEAAANAKANTPYSPTNTNGYLTTEIGDDGKAGLWVTDEEGKFTIDGLRYTYFADGVALQEGDNRIQTYWLVETKALEDHQLLPVPIEFEITGQATVVEQLEVTNAANTGGFSLPLTGGTGTALLTVLGLMILGAVLFIARRRGNAEAA